MTMKIHKTKQRKESQTTKAGTHLSTLAPTIFPARGAPSDSCPESPEISPQTPFPPIANLQQDGKTAGVESST
ncbi:predicted protein [Botrytis cinerea T4]|uniref:Uncharacterized protein n=1 Tax=Botryotinia fuckeliana (strain T4) TaxID=999810 RepID=G2XN53_BOTF4|nr:predicted protein [Botrytis cinerea T4]